MSLNRFGNKTLTGEDDLEVDKINITGEGIGFNDNFGTNGQIIKKSTVDNTIGWFNEQIFTASLPIVLTGNNIGFNSTMGINKVSIITNGGKRELLIGNNIGNDFIKLQENNGLILCSILDIGGISGGAINMTHNSDIAFFSDAGSTRIFTITPTGIMPSNDTRTFNIGHTNFNIGDIFCNNINPKGNITLTNGYITILNTGSIFADLELTGNLEANGDIIGDGSTNINNINNINSSTLTTSGDINANGNIVGDGGTIISGIATINASTITNSTTNSTHINVSQDLDVDGVLTATDTAIFTNGFKQAVGGGTFSLTHVGNLSTSGNIISTSGYIIASALGSILNGLQLTDNLNMSSNYDIQNANNIGTSTLTASGDITANGNIVGDSATNITGINDINSATLTASGDINANGNINGDGSTNINNINDINSTTLTTTGDIQGHGITASGNITANGNINGDGATNITGIADITNATSITTATLTASGDITANGDIKGDYNTELKTSIIHLPADFYWDNTANEATKFILNHEWMCDDDTNFNNLVVSDGTYTIGWLRNMDSTRTQLFAEFLIPRGWKWKGFLVECKNSMGSNLNGGTSKMNIKAFKRTAATTLTELDVDMGGGMVNSTPAFNSIHTLTSSDQLVSGWSSSWLTGSTINRGYLQAYRDDAGGWGNGYFFPNTELFFVRE